MAHYYTDNKDLASKRQEFTYYFANEKFVFTTDIGVFSKESVDFGSYLLIKALYQKELGSSALDLGCGYGPIGIILKRFHPQTEMLAVDVNSRAVELAAFNSKANNTEIETHLCDDIQTLPNTFDSIILNPPIRAGKSVVFDLYRKAYAKLSDKGHLYIVIRLKQGAKSSLKELQNLFMHTEVIDKDAGYWLIDASKA